MSDPFVPSWVDDELNKKPASQVELEMLRAFFDAWEGLHSIPNDGSKRNRARAEAAAQVLVDAAAAVRVFRAPPKIERILNG